MMITRYSKILLVMAVAFFASLAALGNVTDYDTNFRFVQHVLSMDSLFAETAITYRAIQVPLLHHLAYGLIIALEVLVAGLCWVGAWRLWRQVRAPAPCFNRAKAWAMSGLVLAVLLWHVGFMSMGGEWFGMWMSEQWNGLSSAFRFVVISLLVLIYLAQPDQDIDAQA